MIRLVTERDAAGIVEIYNYYVLKTVVSFEEGTLSAPDMQGRINTVRSWGFPWLVAEEKGKIVGYAYATRWKQRHAYRFTVEVSVYLLPSSTSKGLGTKLYRALFSALDSDKVRIVISGIALPNDASIRLHERFGLKKTAHFSQVGFKFDQCIDVGYWQGGLSEVLLCSREMPGNLNDHTFT